MSECTARAGSGQDEHSMPEITDKIIAELEVHQRQDAVPPVFTSALEGG